MLAVELRRIEHLPKHLQIDNLLGKQTQGVKASVPRVINSQ
jgi:hypothetical protein